MLRFINKMLQISLIKYYDAEYNKIKIKNVEIHFETIKHYLNSNREENCWCVRFFTLS